MRSRTTGTGTAGSRYRCEVELLHVSVEHAPYSDDDDGAPAEGAEPVKLLFAVFLLTATATSTAGTAAGRGSRRPAEEALERARDGLNALESLCQEVADAEEAKADSEVPVHQTVLLDYVSRMQAFSRATISVMWELRRGAAAAEVGAGFDAAGLAANIPVLLAARGESSYTATDDLGGVPVFAWGSGLVSMRVGGEWQRVHSALLERTHPKRRRRGLSIFAYATSPLQMGSDFDHIHGFIRTDNESSKARFRPLEDIERERHGRGIDGQTDAGGLLEAYYWDGHTTLLLEKCRRSPGSDDSITLTGAPALSRAVSSSCGVALFAAYFGQEGSDGLLGDQDLRDLAEHECFGGFWTAPLSESLSVMFMIWNPDYVSVQPFSKKGPLGDSQRSRNSVHSVTWMGNWLLLDPHYLTMLEIASAETRQHAALLAAASASVLDDGATECAERLTTVVSEHLLTSTGPNGVRRFAELNFDRRTHQQLLEVIQHSAAADDSPLRVIGCQREVYDGACLSETPRFRSVYESHMIDPRMVSTLAFFEKAAPSSADGPLTTTDIWPSSRL